MPRRGRLTLLAYQAVFAAFLVLFGPVLVWRMVFDARYRRGLWARLGFVKSWSPAEPVVWIHGVSVGEMKAATTLIHEIRRRYPNTKLVLSATTPTGRDIAEKLPADRVFFFPLDFGRAPGRALDRIKPSCVLLMEKELWPNFLHSASRRRVPVAVLNGRISERSYRGYRRVRWMLPQLQTVALWCVQDDAYAERLRALEVDPERIHVTGNMKYDSVTVKTSSPESDAVRAWLAPGGEPIVVGGSTHGMEEIWLAEAIREVAQRIGSGVRIVLAPRHPQRSRGVAEGLEELGFPVRLWSEAVSGPKRRPLAPDEIVLVDTIGHLEMFYGACSVAFVGGSLVSHGGQNMIEPASLGRAVVFGPHVSNFRRDVEILLEARAARQVMSRDAVAGELAELLADETERQKLGEAAVRAILANKGATERTMGRLAPVLGRVPVSGRVNQPTATTR